MSEDASSFLAAAKAKGASDEFLFRLLREQGWTERQILEHFREYYERETGMAIPGKPGSSVGAKDAFLLLLSFATLCVWAFAVGGLLFDAVNRMFPDAVLPQYSNGYSRYTNSQNVASVLVALPVYVWAMRTILRETRLDPAKVESGIRRWLTYIALLFAAGTVIGDVVTFLAYFLRGELTVRFTLKVLVVLLLAGGIFGFYSFFVRKQAENVAEDIRRNLLFAGLAGVLTVAGLGFGFFELGTPEYQRQLEADSRRVQDLKQIGRVIHERKSVPQALRELEGSGAVLQDRIREVPYRFTKISETSYQLCASFDAPYQAKSGDMFWNHTAGESCYALDVKVNPGYSMP